MKKKKNMDNNNDKMVNCFDIMMEGASMSRPSECVWEQDEDGLWISSCGNPYEFYDGGPKYNRFEFCPYCGKQLKEKP